MAPSAASTTPTRLGRVLHWLFPSRRVAVAVAALEAGAVPARASASFRLVVCVALHLVLSVFAD